MNSPDFSELRALAMMEIELDRLIAQRVVDAVRSGMSWEEVATAVGVAKPTAWRRWKPIVDDPRPTRAGRRAATDLLLTADATAVVERLARSLTEAVRARQDGYPLATAVRRVLTSRQQKFDSERRGIETEFRLRGSRLRVTSVERDSVAAGGLSAVTMPDPAKAVRGGASAQADHLPGGDLPADEAKLLRAVQEFIERQFAPDQ